MKKVGKAGTTGLLLGATIMIFSAIQSALEEKRQNEYIKQTVDDKLKEYGFIDPFDGETEDKSFGNFNNDEET